MRELVARGLWWLTHGSNPKPTLFDLGERDEPEVDHTVTNFQDGLAFVWALAVLLIVVSSYGHSWGLVMYRVDGDLVVQPTCEACKLVEPGSWEAWVCKYIFGC